MTRYPKVLMLIFLVAAAGLLQSNRAAAQSAQIYNGASYNAQCLLVNFPQDNVGYSKFIIPPAQYHRGNVGTKVRCQIAIDPAGNSYTWLNYFDANQKGVYTLMFQTVPYGQSTRYATVHAFEQAKRITYTVTNATALPIQLLFLPNRNTAKLAPGKRTSCNSPIRNGELPVVQASSPMGGVYQIPVFWQGCNYKIIPYGGTPQGIAIVPENN